MSSEIDIEAKTSLKNKIFYSVFVLLLIGSVIATFVRIVIMKDYIIVAESSCDPATEKCFVWECNTKIDGECSDNPEENIWYYKIVNKKAYEIVKCEATEEKLGCNEELSCTEGEVSCSYEYCDEENLGEEIRCSKESDMTIYEEDTSIDNASSTEQLED